MLRNFYKFFKLRKCSSGLQTLRIEHLPAIAYEPLLAADIIIFFHKFPN